MKKNNMEYPKDYINKILNGDCLEVMKEIPDESIDLIWFSPPYYNLHNYSNDKREIGKNQTVENYSNSLTLVAKEGQRMLKDTGNFVINIMDLVRNNYPLLLSDLCISGFVTGANLIFIERIVWFIRNKMPVASNVRFVNKFEWIIHFSKTNGYYFDKDSIREPHSEYAEKDKRKWKWNKNGKCPGNVWNIPAYRVTGKNKFHIAGFPIELCERVIKSWCPNGGIVCDPFIGSGTTAVACKELNRNFIGIEINPEYCKIAKQRLSQEFLL